MLLNVAFSELKMKKGKVVLTNRGSILSPDFLAMMYLVLMRQHTGLFVRLFYLIALQY